MIRVNLLPKYREATIDPWDETFVHPMPMPRSSVEWPDGLFFVPYPMCRTGRPRPFCRCGVYRLIWD